MKNLLTYNYLMDLKKKEIDSFERAKLIKEYLESNSLSIRKLAELTGIHHNTLQDWLLWTKISEERYYQLKLIGYTETDIYRHLRDNKPLSKEKIENADPLILKLANMSKYLSFHRKKASKEHIQAIKDVINACNYMLSYAEK